MKQRNEYRWNELSCDAPTNEKMTKKRITIYLHFDSKDYNLNHLNTIESRFIVCGGYFSIIRSLLDVQWSSASSPSPPI
jgi:hypothetical protein